LENETLLEESGRVLSFLNDRGEHSLLERKVNHDGQIISYL